MNFMKTSTSIPKSIDALVNNRFKGNATAIGDWATSSHVERQGTRKAKLAPSGTGDATPAAKP